MKVYQTKEIRNIAVIGGNRTGKTTLCEAMAFHGGVISRRGTVEDKNTLSDYREVAFQRTGGSFSVYSPVVRSGVTTMRLRCVITEV